MNFKFIFCKGIDTYINIYTYTDIRNEYDYIRVYTGEYIEASKILKKMILIYRKIKKNKKKLNCQYDYHIDFLIGKYILDYGDILNCVNRKGESLIEYKKVLSIRLELLKIQKFRDLMDLKNSKSYDYNDTIDIEDNAADGDNVFIESFLGIYINVYVFVKLYAYTCICMYMYTHKFVVNRRYIDIFIPTSTDKFTLYIFLDYGTTGGVRSESVRGEEVGYSREMRDVMGHVAEIYSRLGIDLYMCKISII